MKRIFIICTVRGASDEYKKKLEDYVAKLESETLPKSPRQGFNES